jgi:hypothetical protein
MSASTNQDPADYKHDPAATITDPVNMSSKPDSSTTPSTTSRHDSAQASSTTPKTTSTYAPEMSYEEIKPYQTESETTCRARYAANQRHAKARNSQPQANHTTEASTKDTEKRQVLREKNRVAAAKCRQRQCKQAENIRAKGGRLGEINAQLKSYVEELRGELNCLRAVALGHGDCNDRLARYNQVHAERVMREYYSACGGLADTMMAGEQARPQ